MKTNFFCALIIFCLTMLFEGCVGLKSTMYYGDYNIEMTQVERPVAAKERYGKQTITSQLDSGSSKYFFEDNLVKITWFVTSSKISFVMENKTDHSLKIVWDEAAFVDNAGISQRVMHTGVKYSERNNPQLPTIIVRKGKIYDNIVPTEYVYYREGYYGKYYTNPGGWEEKALFESVQFNGDPQTLQTIMKANVGKTFQVLLPISIENVVNDYIFTFKVNSYTYKGIYKSSK